MTNTFLEVLPAKFSVSDFEKYNLPRPASTDKADLKLVFSTEAEYRQYLNGLEDECNDYLSKYWVIKTPELINKSRFIIKVLTALTRARANNLSNWSC
jgi:hypothetical protein